LGTPVALDLIEQVSIKVLIPVSGFVINYDTELNSYFLKEKGVDFKKINKNIKQSFVIYGNNDPYVSQEVLRSLTENLRVGPEIISDGGHLNTDSDYKTFLRLLEIIKKEIK